MKNSELIDYENQTLYNLVIRATDTDFPSQYSELNLVLNILDAIDNIPEFVAEVFYGVVIENSPAGEFVGHITATDRDSINSGDFLTYRYKITPLT